MNPGLKHRLDRIEKALPKAVPAWDSVAHLTGVLGKYGVVREGNESLAAAFARALGITPGELREELRRRAWGDQR
jgi:hypothetical protein